MALDMAEPADLARLTVGMLDTAGRPELAAWALDLFTRAHWVEGAALAKERRMAGLDQRDENGVWPPKLLQVAASDLDLARYAVSLLEARHKPQLSAWLLDLFGHVHPAEGAELRRERRMWPRLLELLDRPAAQAARTLAGLGRDEVATLQRLAAQEVHRSLRADRRRRLGRIIDAADRRLRSAGRRTHGRRPRGRRLIPRAGAGSESGGLSVRN